MGRQKGLDKARLSIRIPTDLDERLRQRLNDPVRNKVRYGSMSDLVTHMLYEFLKHEDKELTEL